MGAGAVSGEAWPAAIIKAIAPGCVTYVAIAIFAFGSVFKPVFLALEPERLGAPHWTWVPLVCFAIASLSFRIPARLWFLRGPFFYRHRTGRFRARRRGLRRQVDKSRAGEISGNPQTQHSFLQSLRNAPEEYQFYLHAAAMKDCVPYAWSYRTMSFYRVPLSAAINVVPGKWLKECSIDRKNADAW